MTRAPRRCSTYSTAVSLTAGQTYRSTISGDVGQRSPGQRRPTLAPGIAPAVAAAKSATTAVVVVSDDTESEATDRLSLNLPSAQDELISAVAAANPNTVVVIDAGAPIVMPWLQPGQPGARRVVSRPVERDLAGAGAVRARRSRAATCR